MSDKAEFDSDHKAEGRTARKLSNHNIPNLLSVIRIGGSLVLPVIAWFGMEYWFVALYVFLGFTDLIDGPLARWLKQESRSGAKLDSIADILLTAALVAGVCLLKWDLMVGHVYWFVLPIISYAAVLSISLTRFKRFPALHTIFAKANHFLVAIAGLCILLDISTVPLRMVCVTTLLANIEAIAIISQMREWQTDVLSFFHLKYD